MDIVVARQEGCNQCRCAQQQHGYCHETKSALKTGAEFERKDKCTDKKLERFKAHGRRKEG